MGYSFEHQKLILQLIGIQADSWKARFRLIMIATGLIGIFVSILMFLFLRKNYVKKDVVTEAYDKFCLKLAKIGFSRKPSQGPADYAAMVVIQRKDLEKIISEIIDLYILIRYRPDADKSLVRQFRRLIGSFDPKHHFES